MHIAFWEPAVAGRDHPCRSCSIAALLDPLLLGRSVDAAGPGRAAGWARIPPSRELSSQRLHRLLQPERVGLRLLQRLFEPLRVSSQAAEISLEIVVGVLQAVRRRLGARERIGSRP
jgi:hypothetical protein